MIIFESFVPSATSIAYWVTAGPKLTSITLAVMPKDSRVCSITAALPLISPLSVISLPAEKLRGLLNESVNNLLIHAKKECKNHDVSYSELIGEGQPSQRIIDASNDYDMIVISPLGHSMVADLLMGSVAEKVITHSKCFVVVVT